MCLLNLLGELIVPNFNANQWWIDFTPLNRHVADWLLGGIALVVLLRVFWPGAVARLRFTAGLLLTAALLTSIFNGLRYLDLLNSGRLYAGVCIPFSWIVGGALGVLIIGIVRRQRLPATGWRFWTGVLASLAVCFVGMPVAQMVCYGNTDYRRPADAVVVFGARAHADGTLSQALSDRVSTACDLYHKGLVRKLIMSGGPGDGAIHETAAMRAFATSLKVRPQDILVDEQGINTAATVRNTLPIFEKLDARRVLAVSHFYHLPRVKMAYQRAGVEVYTVPARQTYILTATPYLMAREVLAVWYYYAQPLKHAAAGGR
ncbi:MAG: YdcF family protein [Tepidisphaeraceae bacterium]|jgi:vancomycin permeability regulator SanA